MGTKQIGVAILGFGTVGAGVVDGLQRNRALLASRLGCELVLRRVCDLDLDRDRGVAVDRALLTRDAAAAIADPTVDIVVELIGGTGVARTLMTTALRAGKPVVTANKKLLAEHGAELFALAEAANVDLYFGASVGGGIPIVRVLREGLIGNEVRRIVGILNGTCNYILTRMERDRIDFAAALADAQRAGYAEADPGLDIDGHDTAHKAAILASIAYGLQALPAALHVEGIRNLDRLDVDFATALGYRIKLLAILARAGERIEVRVHPTLVPVNHMLASVSGVFNAVMVSGDLAGETLYYGRGAGREPTASTVIGDVADIARNRAARQPRHRHVRPADGAGLAGLLPAAEFRSRCYLRLMVLDQAGSLGRFTGILGSHGVSISAVSQQPTPSRTPGYVPVVVLTHLAREAEVDAALAEIFGCGIVCEPPVRLRLLEA